METCSTCWCQIPFKIRGPAHDHVCDEMARRQKLIDQLTVERDRYKNDLEQLKKGFGVDKCEFIFCEATTCPHHNPRT